ncbi:MAG: FAD-dependent thymidylate synthase [Candidatus Omnitrophica bacterium]|nr:FAD-dependent thymidylate synthase [Candidatus Omnitrophota bacterium]
MHENKFNISEFFGKKEVLDKGHVELFDGMIMDPKLKIVNAARVSFSKEVFELSDKDVKLIEFLHKHEHYSTFRHSYFSFRIKAPLLVFRQFWKYQIGCDWVENENIGTIQIPETNWNEMSGRYVEFQPEFYIPKEIRVQSKNNKQGSEGKLQFLSEGEDPIIYFEQSCLNAYERYEYMVKSGAAKEQARALLPQNIYSECVWTCSLQCVLYVLHQRLKKDAQFEIRQYALAIANLMYPLLQPLEIGQENL